MNKSFQSIVVVCVGLSFVVSVSAQEEETPTGLVDTIVCNFIGGNDMDDLLAVTESWNDWADQNDINNYAAVLLTPHLFSDQTTFDVGWVGFSPNGAAMGAAEGLYVTTGQGIDADFSEVMECTSHTRYAVLPVRTPDGPPPEESGRPGLVAFSDCSVHEGRVVTEALAALGEWTEYLAENGHDGFGGVLFPLAGARDDLNYDFKWVQAFPDTDAYGRLTDIYTRGGFLRADELFGRLLDCDSPRVYLTTQVREMTPPDE